MTNLTHIAGRVLNAPLLIDPGKAETILHVLRDRIGSDLDVPAPEASRFLGTRKDSDGNRTLARRHKGVALIPVLGSLVNRGAWLDASSGLTSYEGLAAQVAEAAADPSVATIVLDIDSPGGEAAGMVGLAAAIREARVQKRVIAFVDDFAASAAYGIASAADEIVVSETSIVGSIGVVLLHLDRSQEMNAKGIKPTLIHAGAHKVDGNPFGPLSDAVKADLQASVDRFYDSFLDTVAAGRGAQSGRRGRTLRTLTKDKARATEARTFIGREAVVAGLADRQGTLASILSDYSSGTRATTRAAARGTALMSHPEDMISAADHRSRIATAVEQANREAAATLATATATAKAEGIAQERARVAAILDCEEAKGREAQASAMAKTDVSADTAKAVLAASPKGSSFGTVAERAAAAESGLSPVSGQGTQPQGSQAPATRPVADVYADRNRAVREAGRR